MQESARIFVLPRVGIDIGRVIVGDDPLDHTRSLLSKNYLEAPEVTSAISAIGELCMSPNWEQIHLISRCSELVQGRTEQWLKHHRFFELTGLPPENVHFCRTSEDKAVLARRFYLSHFVDDQIKNLEVLPAITTNRILFNPTKQPTQKQQENVRIAKDWNDAVKLLNNPPRH